MNTKSFFSKIREIIREEIEYALEKKMTNQKTKKSDISSLEHGLSLYNLFRKNNQKLNLDQ